MIAIIFLVAVGLLLLWLLLRLLKKPIKWAFKLLLSALLGFIALGLLNFIGGPIGLSLPVNWFNVLVSGILGLPGVLILLLIRYIA